MKKLILITAVTLSLASCGNNKKDKETSSINIDGSSTVYPITEAIAEEFRAEDADVDVTIGVSGTGGGFKKFGRGETDISDASRPIKEKEKAAAKENNMFKSTNIQYSLLLDLPLKLA